jgi:hypothetical protein
MRDSRKLEDPSPARPEEAGGEETRSLIAGLNGTMHGLSNLRVHLFETPETPVSGVSVFAQLAPDEISNERGFQATGKGILSRFVSGHDFTACGKTQNGVARSVRA